LSLDSHTHRHLIGLPARWNTSACENQYRGDAQPKILRGAEHSH
jgi:hypothetical protein